MNLNYDPALPMLTGELSAGFSIAAAPAIIDGELPLRSPNTTPVRAWVGEGPSFVPVYQWEDDDEAFDDDDEMDVELDEDDLDEEWEEEEFDIDEEDFEMDEEEDEDFDPYEEEDDDYFEDEPEDMGHQVEDRNPSPCNPAYVVEARRELL